MPRKHLIASSINKKQQLQSKISLKCIREIKAAVKVGGTNPDANPRLKSAIAKALSCNVSRDAIQRNISSSNKDVADLKEVVYEGYGPKGMALIIKALTDNEQRTVSNLRGYFSKLKGELAKPNSVKILFEELGQIIIANDGDITEDKILELTLNYNVVNIEKDESGFQVLVQPSDFFEAKNALENNNIKILDAEIKWIPNTRISVSEDDDALLEKFLDSCENDDDVQWVVHNVGEVL